MNQVDLGQGPGAYVRLLRHGPAAKPFLAAVIARLPISMAPLGTILLIQHIRGAYGIAGLITGAYALGTAAGSPLWGRLMDRFGQPKVIVPTSLTSACLLAAMVLAAVGGAGNPPLVALAAASGAAFPPISPAMRASWRVIFPDREARRVGFAIDASAVELVFVGGPLLLSLLLVFSPPVVPLLVTAGFLGCGGVLYSFTGAARQWRPGVGRLTTGPDPHRHRRSALSAPGVLGVLAVMLMMSIGFGQLDTSMAATAGIVLGGTDRLGILFASIASGSAIGGLVYGAHAWKGEEQRRVPVMLALFACFLATMSLLLHAGIPHLWLLLPLLFVTGLTIAPTLIMQQNILDGLAPAHRVNEAQAFLTASATTGGAAGTALAGILIDAHGPTESFLGAGFAVVAATAVAVASQRRWRAAAEMDAPPAAGTGPAGSEPAGSEPADNEPAEPFAHRSGPA